MHEPLLEAGFGRRVGHCGQTHEAFLEQVDFKRLEARNQHVDPQVVLKAADQVGLRKVLAHNIAVFLVAYELLFADHADASAAGAGGRLEDVNRLEVLLLPVLAKPFVVFRQNVGSRRNFVFVAEHPAHALHVAPHEVLAADAPTACEVVHVLKLVQLFYFVRLNESRPENVPVLGHVVEPSHFERVDYAVVSVRRVVHLKPELLRCWQVLLVILDYPRQVGGQGPLDL